jgi:hypothetical protein
VQCAEVQCRGAEVTDHKRTGLLLSIVAEEPRNVHLRPPPGLSGRPVAGPLHVCLWVNSRRVHNGVWRRQTRSEDEDKVELPGTSPDGESRLQLQLLYFDTVGRTALRHKLTHRQCPQTDPLPL